MTDVMEAPVSNGTTPEPEQAKYLSVEQILAAPPDCKERDLEVPEWGGTVKLRSPTALAGAEIKAAGIKWSDDGQVEGMDLAAMERAQIKYGVVVPAFSDSAVEAMQSRFGPSWQRVVQALDDLGGNIVKRARDDEAVRKDAERSFRPAA